VTFNQAVRDMIHYVSDSLRQSGQDHALHMMACSGQRCVEWTMGEYWKCQVDSYTIECQSLAGVEGSGIGGCQWESLH
jgi:hypothetical protein